MRSLSNALSMTRRPLDNYFGVRIPYYPITLAHSFMGEGEAARRLRSFCKSRDARVRVQQAIGPHAFSEPSPGRHAGC